MASFVLDQTRIYYDGLDLGTYTNSLTAGFTTNQNDVTNFNSAGWQEFLPGLRKGTFQIGGFWSLAEPDATLRAAVDTNPADPAMTLTPTGVEGETAYLMRPLSLTRSFGGAVGEVASDNLSGTTDQPVYRGGLSIAHQTVTGPSNGTVVQIPGGAPAGKTLAATLHVFGVDGTNLSVILERSATSNMAGATTVHTFAATTGGAQWFRSSSVNSTQAYYRLRVSALTGTSFVIAAAVGVA